MKTLAVSLSRLLVLVVALVVLTGGAVVPAQAAVAPQGALVERLAPLQPAFLPQPPALAGQSVGVAATQTYSVTVDTELSQALPTTNFSNTLGLYIGYDGGQSQRILLDVPVWQIPPGVNIVSATLNIYLNGYSDSSVIPRTITAYRATSLWHEALATWNHAPSYDSSVGSISIGTPGAATWYGMNLTSIVRDWYAGTYQNFGLVLVGPEGGDEYYRCFTSGEEVHYPRLDVTYTPISPTLNVTPATFSFLASPAAIVPTTQTLTVLNSGGSAFDWSASIGTATWIKPAVTSGTVFTGAMQTVGVSVNPGALGYGTHTGQIQLTSSTPGVQGSPRTVTVTLIYSPTLQSVYLPLVSNNSGASTRSTAALLIGITDYLYLGPDPLFLALPGGRAGAWGYDLNYPVNDVRRVKQVLQNIGGFANANILSLTDGQATRANIVNAFQQLDNLEGANTLVVVYYSGHGGQVADEASGDETGDHLDEFVAAYDTNSSPSYTNIIRDDDLAQLLSTLESNHVVVILDSCFSGGMATGMLGAHDTARGLALPGGMSASQAETDGLALDIAQTGRVVVTASQFDQASWEFGEFEQGVFTYYYLQGLMDTSADTNHNSWVSAEEAYTYAASRTDTYVYNNTKLHEHQNPQIDNRVTGEVDLTLP